MSQPGVLPQGTDAQAPTLLVEALHQRAAVALVTVIAAGESQAQLVGRHLLVWQDPGRAPFGSLGDALPEPALNQAVAEARAALAAGQHRTVVLAAPGPEATPVQAHTAPAAPLAVTLFVEVQLPPAHLIIVGAGHIAAPLAAIARICDFEVSVLDDRPQYANRQRFPDATRVIAGPFAQELRTLRNGQPHFDANTYLVLVTRGHQHDVACLLEVLDDPVAYIGMIGSRRRIRAVYELLEREQGIAPARLDRIRAPIGLDIGAQTPAEIAVCIMGEIIAMQRGGAAPALSDALRSERLRRRARAGVGAQTDPGAEAATQE